MKAMHCAWRPKGYIWWKGEYRRLVIQGGVSTPTLVQYHNTGRRDAGAAVTFKVPFPNKTISGNCLVAFVTCDVVAGITVAASDDVNGAWTLAKSQTGGNRNVYCFAFANSAVGAKLLTITFGGGQTGGDVCVSFSEWAGVATSTPWTAGSSGADVTGNTAWATGAFTPTSSGCLIMQYAADASGSTPYTFTVGTNFTFLSADGVEGQPCQFYVQSSAVSITPTITVNSAHSCTTVAVAFTAGSSGGTNTGMYVKGVHHFGWAFNGVMGNGPGFAAIQVPTFGNLFICSSSTALQHISTVTDSKSNSYSHTTNSPHHNASATNTVQNMLHADNTTSDPNMTVTITLASAMVSGDGIHFRFMDIAGAPASPYDKDAAFDGNQTTQSATLQVVTGFSPTGAGLVVCGSDQFTGTMTGVSAPAAALFGNGLASDQDGGLSNFTLDDGKGHYYNPDSTAITWTWNTTNDVGGAGFFAGIIAAFKAPAVAGGPPQITVRSQAVQRSVT